MALKRLERIPLHDHVDRNSGGPLDGSTVRKAAGLGGDPTVGEHADLAGVTSDQHHAQSHDHSASADGTALAPATLTIPGASSPAQTAEGSAVWDSDDDVLTVGDGASRKTFGYIGSTAPTITYGTATAGSAKEVLRKDAVIAKPTEADLSITDNTTGNVSTSAHGFAPKAPNDPTKYLDGAGNYTTPGTVSGATALGLSPYAYPIGFVPTSTVSNQATLGANGGSRAAAIFVGAPGYLDGVYCRSLDTASARSWRWDLYYQASPGSATLTRVATSNGSEAFTAAAQSTRYLAASGAPVFLLPGLYWLVIQNSHATNTFQLGVVLAGTMSLDIAVSNLTLTGTNGATIDLTSAGWGRVPSIIACALYFRVFNEGAAF